MIVREDLLGRAMHAPPSFDFQTVADNGSMYNTPPTYGIHRRAGLPVAQAPGRGGGDRGAERRQAKLLYDFLDASGFYENRIDPPAVRA